MLSRSSLSLLLLFGAYGGLAVGLREDKPAEKAPPAARQTAVLPGVRPGGEVLLPNGWSLRPAGKQVALGDFPVNLALHPDGKHAAALHAGYGAHEVVVVSLDEKRPKITSRVSIDQAFQGLTFSPDGKTLYASGGEFDEVHAFSFEGGLLGKRAAIRITGVKDRFVVGGITSDRKGENLFVCGTWGDEVRIVPLNKPGDQR